MEENTTGGSNTALGDETLEFNTTGSYSVAVGNDALYSNTTGSSSTAVGNAALLVATTGSHNTAFGKEAGASNTTGGDNVFIGHYAGKTQNTTGSGHLYVARSNTGAGNANTWIYGNDAGACWQGNNSSSWSTTSDRRLKKNIVDSPKGLAEVEQLRVTNFEYRTEDEIDISEFPLADSTHQVVLGEGKEGEIQTGIIAQELESILPECIEISERGAKTVNTDPIMWALINAVKELSAKVKALEAK